MHSLNAKPKIIALVGKTATGKSDLGVFLAQKVNGEVVSADSRQVYKNLDLGTGKITEKEMGGIVHHMLDVAPPTSIYSVEQFKNDASKVILDILQRNKVPIIVGGTGFYVDSLVYDVTFPQVPPNPQVRERLEKLPVSELYKILTEKDPERAASIDQHNKVRLVRALEIIESVGNVPTLEKNEKFDCLWIGIDIPDDELKQKIRKRLTERLESGMLEEARQLLAQGLNHERMDQLGLEYRYMSRYIRGILSYDDFLTELQSEIWRFAKRQKIWFKRNKLIKWFHPKDKEKILEELISFLK